MYTFEKGRLIGTGMTGLVKNKAFVQNRNVYYAQEIFRVEGCAVRIRGDKTCSGRSLANVDTLQRILVSVYLRRVALDLCRFSIPLNAGVLVHRGCWPQPAPGITLFASVSSHMKKWPRVKSLRAFILYLLKFVSSYLASEDALWQQLRREEMDNDARGFFEKEKGGLAHKDVFGRLSAF